MKNWQKTLNISGLVGDNDVDDVLPAATLLAIKDRVLEIDSKAEFRETSLAHYKAMNLETEKDRANFMEDLYDWADDNDIWIETSKMTA